MKLLILSTPRTGSNLLCECMTQAKLWGEVDAFFVGSGEGIAHNFKRNANEWIGKHSSPEGHFATKVMWDYLDTLAQFATGEEEYTGYRWFIEKFDRVVFLERKDKVAQAVSWYVAFKSGKWTSKGDFTRPMPKYDYYRIAWQLEQILGFEARSKVFIKHNKLPCFEMNYEENVRNLDLAVMQIATFCGLNAENPHVNPQLKRQHNPIKKEFIRKFTEDLRA